MAIVIDNKTGEILAFSNYPTFDPNKLNEISPENLPNRRDPEYLFARLGLQARDIRLGAREEASSLPKTRSTAATERSRSRSTSLPIRTRSAA